MVGKTHTMKTGNELLGSHSGLWRTCLDIEVVRGSEEESGEIISNCTNLFDLMEDAEKAKKQVSRFFVLLFSREQATL